MNEKSISEEASNAIIKLGVVVLTQPNIDAETQARCQDYLRIVKSYIAALEDEIDKIKEIERRRWENVPGNWRRER